MTRTDSSTIRAAPGPVGWTDLTAAAGAAHVGDAPHPDGEAVVVLAHLSDLHICDAESPARIEYLERHGLRGAPYQRLLGDIGCYRPQELLTVPVAIAMVEAINRHPIGPITGHRVEAAVLTGDLVDNAQRNELDWYRTVLTGGEVQPGSGGVDGSEWVGAPDAVWHPSYWHPEGHRSGRFDWWTTERGFPMVPGLLDRARDRFTSPGLDLPWFGVHGNHDLLLQGTVPASAGERALAVGDARITDLNPDATVLAVLEAIARVGPARYPRADGAPTTAATPDVGRRILSPLEFAASHDTLAHHGVERGPVNAFTAPLNPLVRLIAIDTVNPHGGWEGSLDRAQFEWVGQQLRQAPEPYLVIASHHPSWCLVNGYRPDGADDRVLADEVLRRLLSEPRVVVWLAGHVHHHSVTLHRRRHRVLPEITSASLIDWPQQARTIEIVREPGGHLVLAGTAIDHGGPVRPDLRRLDDPGHLAALSRSLAANAPGARSARSAGGPGGTLECNTIFRVPDPARRRPDPQADSGN